MEHLLKDTAERAWRYRRSLHDRTVAPTPEALANLRRLDEPLPEAPTDPEAVIAQLDELGSPATMASAGGRFFGFVVGSSLPATLAANWLAGAWDQNAGIVVLSPIAAKLEEVAMRWMLGLLGLPPECGAGFVTCATQANFAGLAAARHALLARRGWDVETRGLFGAPPITVVVSEQVHECPQSVDAARPGARAGDQRSRRWPRQNTQRRDAAARRRYDRVPAGRRRQYRGVRPRRGNHPARQGRRRLGPRGRRLRALGGGGSCSRAPRERLRRRLFVGDGRPQVAQRAV